MLGTAFAATSSDVAAAASPLGLDCGNTVAGGSSVKLPAVVPTTTLVVSPEVLSCASGVEMESSSGDI